MFKPKYIITKDGNIIVFPATMQHLDFRNLEPISAGFISFKYNRSGSLSCSCYGESISLNLNSRPEQDSEIANRQLIGQY